MVIKSASGFLKRFKGFMFKLNVIDYGLVFKNCNGIHTFFMFQSIDVVITDINHKIIAIFPNLKPWRIIWPRKNAYYVYELPLNSVSNLTIGDFFKGF